MHIYWYLKSNPAKFHPNPIWNDGALGVIEEHHPQQNEEEGQDEQWYRMSFWSKNWFNCTFVNVSLIANVYYVKDFDMFT